MKFEQCRYCGEVFVPSIKISSIIETEESRESRKGLLRDTFLVYHDRFCDDCCTKFLNLRLNEFMANGKSFVVRKFVSLEELETELKECGIQVWMSPLCL